MAIADTHPGRKGHTLTDWRPEDPQFWDAQGSAIAARNLWISIPCLLLAFSVWLVWSVVVAKMPAIGFNYSVGERFWLAALPGLSGATLRIFYSFMIPIFGGRLWTALSTASLLLPALGCLELDIDRLHADELCGAVGIADCGSVLEGGLACAVALDARGSLTFTGAAQT